MIILRELLEATWDTTLLSLDLRDGPGGKLIKEYKLGEGVNEDACSTHEYHDVKAGRLELIDAKINHHGESKKNGQVESGWGTDFDKIPSDLLDCYVSHFWQSSDRTSSRGGHWIHAHIYRSQQTLGDLLKGGTP